MNEIRTLIWKEVTLEWRQKYALSGMLLYVISTVFVCYLSFNLRRNQLTPIVWNTLFWIIILFTAVNAIAKSFSQERYGRLLYYYSLCSPQAIIISKIIYNSLIMLLLSGMGFVFYSFVMGNAIGDMGLFILCLFLAAIGFASVLLTNEYWGHNTSLGFGLLESALRSGGDPMLSATGTSVPR